MMSDFSNFSVIGGGKTLLPLKRYEDYTDPENAIECDICGSNHETKRCTFLPEEQTISDSKALSRARLTLPPNLKVETLGDGTTAVKTLAVFKKGTRFGPMEAKKTRALNPFTTFPLKVFGRTERQTFYLDTSSEDSCNWMCLIPGSTERPDNPGALNLMCYQMNEAIFYTTTRLIKEGEWLRVGYAPNYAVRMGLKPLIIFQDKNEEKEVKKLQKEADEKMRHQIVDQLSAKELGVPRDRVVSRWTCQLCKQDFNKVDAYASHLREHYKLSAKVAFPKRRKKKCDRTCDSCNTEFKTRRLMLKHVCSRSNLTVGHLRTSDDLVSMEGMAPLEGPNETLERLLQQYEASADMFGLETAPSSTPRHSSLSDASFDSSHFLTMPRPESRLAKPPSDKPADEGSFLGLNPNDSFNPEQFLNDELSLDKFKIPEGKILDMEGASLDMSNISMFSLDQNQLLNGEEYLNPHISIGEQSRDSPANLFDLEQSFQKQVTRILTNIDGELTKMTHEDASAGLKPTDGFDAKTSFADGDADFETRYDRTEGERLAAETQCAICAKAFANKSNLARHMRKHTGDFVCTTCFVVFARKDTLYNHKCALNPSLAKFDCDTCSRKFTRKTYLERHIASKHLGLWRCERCSKSYSSEQYLSVHECSAQQDKSHPPSYRCTFCSKTFAKRIYLNQHLKRHPTSRCRHCGKTLVNVERHESYCSQASDLDPDGLAKCPDCDQVIIDLVTFRRHALKHTHPWACPVCGVMFGAARLLEEHRCSEIKCDVCPESFSTFSAFQAHSSSHGVPDHHCFECGISYHTLEGITSHECTGLREMRKNTKNHRLMRANVSRLIATGQPTRAPAAEEARQYVCDQCGRVFQLKSSLVFHIQQHNGVKYQCHICDVVFDRKDVLKNHLTVHQEPQLPCPQCGRRFKTSKSLDVHMRSHTGSGFSCHRCDLTFTQKQHLMRHLTRHEPELKKLMRRQCTVCLAWLNSQYLLRRHMLAHEARNQRCPVSTCGKDFGSPGLLKAHIRTIHLHGGYTCPYCSKTIRFKTSMKRHLLAIHGDNKKEFQAPGFLDSLKTPAIEAEIQDLLKNTVSVEEGPVEGEVVPEEDVLITFPSGTEPRVDGGNVSVKYVNENGEEVDVLVDVGLSTLEEPVGEERETVDDPADARDDADAVREDNAPALNTDDNANELVWIEDGMILQLGGDNEISFIVVGSENQADNVDVDPDNADGDVAQR